MTHRTMSECSYQQINYVERIGHEVVTRFSGGFGQGFRLLVGVFVGVLGEGEENYNTGIRMTERSGTVLMSPPLEDMEGRKAMFYLTMHSTHFIYNYTALDIW